MSPFHPANATADEITNPIASGRTVPSNCRSIAPPITEPSTPGIIPISAAAVPATCPSGRIAAAFRFGISICWKNNTQPRSTANSRNGGSPEVATATASRTPPAVRFAMNDSRMMRSRPSRSTNRPLTYIAEPITTASAPKTTGNQSPSPNTWSRMISELARYDRNTPNSAVRAIR